LRVIVEGGAMTAPVAAAPAPIAVTEEAPRQPASVTKRWRLVFYLPSDALIYGTNPALLLEELAQIGPTKVTALTDRIPTLDVLDPETPHIGWQVDIEAEDPTSSIDDVFLFLRDNMELSLTP